MKLLHALQHGRRKWNEQTVSRAIAQLQLSSDDDNRGLRCNNVRCVPMLHIARSSSSNSKRTPQSTDNKETLPSTPYSMLSKEAATAPIDYPISSRLWALPPAIAIHLSIGSVYVYSMWTPGMSHALGAFFLP
jgi:hypothetical protein